jgi:lipid-A-disaccharide synthase
MKRCVDHVAVVLPFETALYQRAGIPVDFVGHPFVVDHELPEALPESERTWVALLPGSRASEVRHMLPLFAKTAREIKQLDPEARFVVARSPVVPESLYRRTLATSGIDARLEDAVDALARARVALVASGTATLQSALLETPLVIAYRTSALNYWLARRLVTIPHVGLVNVLLGEEVAPEFVQERARPADMAQALAALLGDGAARERVRERFRGLRASLSGGRGAERVAELALDLASRKKAS